MPCAEVPLLQRYQPEPELHTDENRFRGVGSSWLGKAVGEQELIHWRRLFPVLSASEMAAVTVRPAVDPQQQHTTFSLTTTPASLTLNESTQPGMWGSKIVSGAFTPAEVGLLEALLPSAATRCTRQAEPVSPWQHLYLEGWAGNMTLST